MKQLIEDYKKKIETLANDLRLYKSTGSINDIKKVERLTTKLFEYRAFVIDLERIERNVQPDETPQLISRIDFTTLRTQKKTLIEIIDDMEKKNAEYYKNETSDLSGILNLIDAIQDYAVDVVGLNPIDVFDFEFEESREDVVKSNKSDLLDNEELYVKDIIARKKQGIDCTEEESAEIKGYLRELKMPDEFKLYLENLGLKYYEHNDFTEIISKADIIYMTRVQKERFSDPIEYEKVKNVYVLRNSMLKNTKDNMRILHPLPRVNEIHQDVDTNPKAYYFEQALNGVFTRQAILCSLLGIK